MSFLYNLFPPPSYLNIPALGVDLSDRSFKFIEIKRTRQGLLPLRLGSEIVPKNIIVSGEIRDHAAVVSFLRKMQEQIGKKDILVSLPEEKVYTRIFKLPFIENESEIRQAVEAEFSEYIPIPLDESIFDFEIIEKNEKEKYTEVKVLACSRIISESYRDVFQSAGFNPLVFEAETSALARAVVPKGDSFGAFMIIDFGRTRTSFIIVNKGNMAFTSTIAVAGKDIDGALAKEFSVSIFEAERIKKEKGILRPKANDKISNAILPAISIVKEETKKHIRFWDTRLTEENMNNISSIQRIIVCGGDANLIGLTDYFSYELGLPVEYANVWENAFSLNKYIPEIPFRKSLVYGTAIGLALRFIDF